MLGRLQSLTGIFSRTTRLLSSNRKGGESKKIIHRLPPILWKPEDEFPRAPKGTLRKFVRTTRATFRNGWHISRRVFHIAFSTMFLQTEVLIAIVIAAKIVMIIGAIEALMILNLQACSFQDALHFTTQYATLNIIPSCVWDSVKPVLLARRLHLDPNEVLYKYSESPQDASYEIRLMQLRCSRCVVAGSMVVAQLIRVVGQLVQAAERYRSNVLFGTEPPVPRTRQRIIRLCGKYSDVSFVSLLRHQDHILPIFERQPRWYMKQLLRKLMTIQKRWQWHPLFWTVEHDEYGSRMAWQALGDTTFRRNFFVETLSGKNLLIIEADATDEEDALNLGAGCTDLDLDDASQACQQIISQFYAKGMQDFKPLRVFLGDPMQKVTTGRGRKLTLADRVKITNEVDVIINSRAAILYAIIQWCKKVLVDEKYKEIVFDTNDDEYYTKLKAIMAELGFNLIDVDQLSSAELDYREAMEKYEKCVAERAQDKEAKNGDEQTEESEPEELVEPVAPRKLPRLLYHSTTNMTVMHFNNRLSSASIDLQRCCVVVDKVQGDIEMQWRKKRLENGKQLEVICSSLLWDDLLRQVRVWARLEHSAESIQAELDHRMKEILIAEKAALGQLKLQQKPDKEDD